jgi:MoaA/NifB/PqqE/SkfB family radical SAM enzyme
MLDSSDYIKLLNFIAKQKNSNTRIKINLSEEGYWGPKWECVIRDDFHYCGSGIIISSILYDGKVTSCPSVSRKFIEGNIKDSSFLIFGRMNLRFTGMKKTRYLQIYVQIVPIGIYVKVGGSIY